MQLTKSILKTFVLSVLMAAQVHFAYAQTASILPPAKTTFNDRNGKPLSSGTVDFYIPSTTTRKTTWQDAAETVPNTNPVVLDSSGRALILGSGSYRQVVKDQSGNLIWDQVTSSTGSGSSGGSTATGDGDLVGTIKPWAGMTAPNQYMFTYGQELSRSTFATLFTAITSQQTVFCNTGSPVLNGLSDTTNFWIGMSVEISCVGAGFSTIVSKTVSTVTLAANANVTSTNTATFFPWGRGNGATTFNLPDYRGIIPAGNNNMGGTSSANLTTTFFGATDPNSAGALGGAQSTSITLLLGNLPPYTPTTASVTNGLITFPSSQVTSVASGANAGMTTGPSSANANLTTILTPVQAATTVTMNAQGGTSTPIVFSRIQPTRTINYIIKVTPDSNSLTASGVTSLGSMTGDIACGTGLLCTGNNISVVNIPFATTVSSGGVLASTCSSSNWFSSLANGTGVFGCTQPNFTDLAGTIAIGQVPTASNAQYLAGTANRVVQAGTLYQSEVTVTFGTTTTFDFSTFINAVVTLTGNITTQTLSNITAGKAGTIVFIQDATGSRTTVWNSNFKFASGTTPNLTTTANAVDVLSYSCRTATFCIASLIKDVR